MSAKRISSRLETIGLKLENMAERVSALRDQIDDQLMACGDLSERARDALAPGAPERAEGALRELSWKVIGIAGELTEAGATIDRIVDELEP